MRSGTSRCSGGTFYAHAAANHHQAVSVAWMTCTVPPPLHSPPLPSCAGETSTALATVVRNHARTVRLWAQEVEDAQDRLCVRCMPGDLGYAPRCFALRRTHSARTSAQQIILSCGLGRMRSHIPDPRTSSLITVPTPMRGKVTHDVWCACATQLCEV